MCPARRLAVVATGARSTAPQLRVVIVGGGLSGAVAALRLMEAGNDPLALTIVEPRERLGRGIAFSTNEPEQLMRGPACTLSLYPEAPQHFVRWLDAEAGRGGWRPAGGAAFGVSQPPRGHFGSYVESRLAVTAADNFGRVRFRHRRDHALGIGKLGREFVVALAGGGTLLAEVVVLAAGLTCRGDAGPSPGDDALVRSLVDRGLARRHASAAGIEVDPLTLAVVPAAGGAGAGRLFAIGQPQSGPEWESTAVGEIALQARRLGETVTALGVAGTPAIRRGA